MNWRVYYSGGASFSSDDGDPHEAPSVDVQIIQQGEDLLFYHDYYLWRTDLCLWVPCNGTEGLVDHLTSFVRRIDAVVMGRYMDRESWTALMHKVHADIAKHGWSAGEARQLERRGVI